MAITKRTVGIIGLGRIGSRCAYSLALGGVADELVLYDIDDRRARSEASDIGDAVAYMPHRVDIRTGGYDQLARCDIVAITAGVVSDSKDRLSLLSGNARIADEVADNLTRHGFGGILAVIINPCDVLALHLSRRMGLPRGRVLSTGTALDSARLKKQLAEATGVEHNSISAIVMGEHGASQVIPWSAVTVYGRTLGELAEKDPRFAVDREEIRTRVLGGAWTAVDGKGVAEYGVAASFARCASLIFRDARAIFPISAELTGEYGVSGVFSGVPAILGKNGVQQVLELRLTQPELSDFRRSCGIIRQAADTL